MAPVVDRLKRDYEGRVDFVLYDVEKDDDGAALAEEWGLQYVPTFVFMNSDGTEVDRVVGAIPESTLISTLDSLE